MKPFTTFREDLASGRPAKKPVSSNLLKQRAIANKKALDTGFMKLTPQERAKESKRLGEEKKNCGCGQDPCITYGKEKKMKESARDNYNPVVSDKRTKEKLKKAGLPPESPKVNKDILNMEQQIRAFAEGKKKGLDGKACWKGYKLQGTKKKGNKTVDNCVPVNEISDHLKTRYIHKAMGDIDNKERASQLADKQGAPASVGKSLSKSTGKRRKGIARARANLERPIKEQSIFEISDALKKRYLAKAGKQVTSKEKMKDYQLGQMDKQKDKPASLPREKFTKADKAFVKNKYDKDTLKRRKGMAQARSKLGEAKKPVVHSTKPDSLKTVKIKYNKPIKTKVTDIGPGGKEVVRKDWSEGVERDPKSNSFNRTKRKETTVRVGQKRDKKTGKMVDVMGKSSAPQGLPSMKEHQIQLVTNLDFNESLGMLVSRGLNKVRGAIKDAEKRTGYKVDPSKNKHSNPVSGKNIAKRLASQKKR